MGIFTMTDYKDKIEEIFSIVLDVGFHKDEKELKLLSLIQEVQKDTLEGFKEFAIEADKFHFNPSLIEEYLSKESEGK